MKTISTIALLATFAVASAEPFTVSRGPEWIPLEVANEVLEGSALDFSFLSENAPTGRLPRVVARGRHFEFEASPGVPRRFYGVNICGDANFTPPEHARAFVRQLRRRGYNALRLHHHDNGLVAGSSDGTTINPERLDRLDAFVAACAENGIYVTTDLFVSRRIPWRAIGRDRDGFVGFEEFKELVLVDEAAYSNLCAFVRIWMTHVNPYTGMRWADDPTIAFLAVVNEGHLGIGGLEKLNRHPEYVAAWKEYAARVDCPYEEIPAGKPWDKTPEMAAAMPFLAELEQRFLGRIRTFLKDELGVKALLTDMSAGMENEAYRPVRAALCDYVDEHWYWDHPSFPSNNWSYPSVGHNQNPVRARGSNVLELCSGVGHPDKPFVATEYSFSGPNPFRHMGGLVAGSQAAREDWAALWHFDWAVNEPTLDRLDETPARWFELSGDPLAMAADRATMCLFLRGDIGAGEDSAIAADRVAGSFIVDTPSTAGGFAEDGRIDAGACSFTTKGPATVWASSLDGLPLRESKRILVSHLTDLCNEGQTFEDDTRRVLLSWGRLPHLVRAGRAEISLALEPGIVSVHALDTAGRRVREVPSSRTADGRLVFVADVAAAPESATFLYEVENRPAKVDVRPGTTSDPAASAAGLLVACDGTYGWPGVELRPKDGGYWDFSGVGALEVVVSNAGDRAETISAHAIAKGADRGKVEPRSVRVRPGECRTIHLLLADARILTDEPVKLERMRGKVGCLADNGHNWAETASVEVFQCQPGNLHPLRFAVLDVRTAFDGVRPKVVPAADFFPFCDRYGQLRHLDWPGKIHSDEDLAEARRREEAWLAAHQAGPIPDADKYGGWAGGPQLKATGFFRTEKVDGKWWLVDPEGHLFFSLGITCVYIGMETVPDNRQHYFEWLPPWETLPPCWDDPTLRHVNFTQLNMERKYGADYRTIFADMAHRRFRAWGINTLGNWTPERIRLLRRTPYVATIDFSSKTRLAAVKKAVFGRKMPDVFSPQFAADVREQAEKLAEKIGDDPWCVGVFVDNELDWDSPEDVPAVAEKYFATVAAELKAALPNHLYLGCRFAGGGDEAWRAASRHCDVVSYNYYARRPEKELPPGSDDKPLIVGEFHFGALDRGSLATGCDGGRAFDQNERAQCFRDYVNFCLDDPRHVGCHWFQYTDQGITGRFDGENFNCGFIDVCDTPYPELVEACRATAAEMYPRRAAATPIGK